MSNILTQDNIRYNIDTLNSDLSGLIITNNYSVDCSNLSKITKIQVNGLIPEKSFAYFLFNLSNQWAALDSNGAAVNLSLVSSPSLEDLKTYGNTPQDLAALSNVPALANKTFAVAIGLISADPANSLPKVSLTFSGVTDSQSLIYTQYSPVYELNNSQITGITPDINTQGTGKITITGQYTTTDNLLSDWLPLEQITGKKINSLQFKVDYSVDEINSNSFATLNAIKIIYSRIVENISAANAQNSELISTTENWYIPLHNCRLTVKHSPLKNSSLRTFLALRSTPILIKNENLGIGSGTRKTFQLAKTNGIKYDTVKIYFDGAHIYSDFEVNSELGRVTCSAPEGALVSCDYEYGWNSEIWQEMTKGDTISYMDYDTTEFSIYIPENNLSVCAIKITSEQSDGYIQNENIGRGTGITQTYKLSHIVKNGEISIFANSSKLNSKNFLLHDDNQLISIAAPSGQNLSASYNWISEVISIYQFAAVFSK